MAKETSKEVKEAGFVDNKTEAAQGWTSQRGTERGKKPVYPAGEFAANARKTFGTRPECVLTALKAAGKAECTVSEAREIVERFLRREVW